MARGSRRQSSVGVGRSGCPCIGDQIGEVRTPIGGHLNAVSCDGCAAITAGGGP